jgi:hypothetical protein
LGPAETQLFFRLPNNEEPGGKEWSLSILLSPSDSLARDKSWKDKIRS